MKKVCLGLLALVGVASADKGFFGLGLATGADLDGGVGALHGRVWIQESNAVDVTGSLSFESNAFSLGADYKMFDYSTIQLQTGKLPWYWGVGGLININGDELDVGARVPVGLSWEPASIPFDFFIEAAAQTSVNALSSKKPVNFGATVGFHWYIN